MKTKTGSTPDSLIKKLIKWVFYADTLEGITLNSILAFFLVAEIPATIIALSNNLYADAVSCFLWFLTCLIFILFPSHKRLKYYWIIFIFGNISIGYAWMNFGGLAESPTYFFLTIVIFTAVVTRSSKHIWYFSILYIIIGVLFYLDFAHPEIITYPKVDPEKIKVDNLFTFVNILTVFVLGMHLFKRAFDRLRDELNAKNQELTEINQEKTDFFTNLAHETKTPLTLISNYLDKYKRENGLNDSLQVIEENIEKLKNDMLNFLDSEKFLNGKSLYNHYTIIDLSNLIERKLVIASEWIESNGIELTSSIGSKVYIKADHSAIDRIINNLIDNAIKYTPAPGYLSISVKVVSRDIKLVFKDNGIGIKESELKNVFNPYYQISHKKMNSQGIGLGLSIVKNIVDQLNGSINIESIEKEGTSVIISLPKYELLPGDNFSSDVPKNTVTKANPNKPTKAHSLDFERSDKRILIVEDNDAMRKYLEEELTQHYHVQSAINGKEAIDKLQTNVQKPDLILSDIMMDEMDGLAFIDALKKESRFKQIPVIFISAKGTEQERLEGIEKGAIDYINKPFSTNELLAKIKSIFSVQEELSETTIRTLVDTLKGNLSSVENISANKESSFDENCRAFNISKREKDVFVLLKEGKTRKEIASQLHISEKTVARHIDNMFNKAAVNNKTSLINKLEM